MTVLESWASSLGFLAEDLAVGVEAMARRLHLVMGDTDGPAGGRQEPDGYGGIDRRGDFGRMMLSDWMLADAEPEEFLRRIAFGETSFLQLQHSEPHPPSRIVVLVDSGPTQLGAPRLVQLAGLVVLSRRARSRQVSLHLGVLGDDPAKAATGELPELFQQWLHSRRPTIGTELDVECWLDAIEDDAAIWLFGAPNINDGALAARARRLVATEGAWGPDGVKSIDVRVDGNALSLDVPHADDSLRLLRGQGLRRRARTTTMTSRGDLRFPSFPGSVRRLVCRGGEDHELVTVGIPKNPDAGGGRPRRRQFPGPVLAATVVGPRTVALVAAHGGLRVVVVGKRLGNVDRIDLSLSDLELDGSDVEELCGTRLEPLFFDSGQLVVRLRDQWWSIDPLGEPCKMTYVAGAATPVADGPSFAVHTSAGLYARRRSLLDVGLGARVLLGPSGTLLAEAAPGEWVIAGTNGTESSAHERISVPSDATVHGVTSIAHVPMLVVQSPGGQLLPLSATAGPRHSRSFPLTSLMLRYIPPNR